LVKELYAKDNWSVIKYFHHFDHSNIIKIQQIFELFFKVLIELKFFNFQSPMYLITKFLSLAHIKLLD
jgi:hypothetical protein